MKQISADGGGGVYIHNGSSFICNSGCIKNNRLNIYPGEDVTGSGVLLQYGSTSCTFASGNAADYIFDNSPNNCQLNARGY